MKNTAPIVLFCYNRPWHVRQTLESLKNNSLASKSTLYIYSDGPKDINDKKRVKEVRKVLREKKWCKKVIIYESKENKGLTDSIVQGVTKIVNRYGKIIVLEDDLMLSKGFLQFMNNALDKFNDIERIGSVTGYVYPYKKYPPQPYFLIGGNCWGWGTWKRAWDVYEKDSGFLYYYILTHKMIKRFDFDGYAGYVRMLKDVREKKIQSWAINWYASLFIHKLLGYHPNVSLVQNIGFDGSGEHRTQTEKYWTKMVNYVKVQKIPQRESEFVYTQMVSFYKSLQPSLASKLIDIFQNKILQ